MAKFSAKVVEDGDDDEVPARAAKRKVDGARGAASGTADSGGVFENRRKQLKIAGDGGGVGSSGKEGGRRKAANGVGEDGGLSVKIDPDLLECSVCFEDLAPPIFQCQNGHVACSSCWLKLQNKCHTCVLNGNLFRNIALEKLIESIKLRCAHAKWGCCEIISYISRHKHEQDCIYAPCPCPITGCNFKGTSGWWAKHFLAEHREDTINFSYDSPFEVYLKDDEPFRVLIAEEDDEDGDLFLLLNENAPLFGHALSMVCLRNCKLDMKFSYALSVVKIGTTLSTLHMSAPMIDMKMWTGVHPRNDFLLVPYEYSHNNSRQILMDVTIWKSSDHTVAP